jgi:hypothetical protein
MYMYITTCLAHAPPPVPYNTAAIHHQSIDNIIIHNYTGSQYSLNVQTTQNQKH